MMLSSLACQLQRQQHSLQCRALSILSTCQISHDPRSLFFKATSRAATSSDIRRLSSIARNKTALVLGSSGVLGSSVSRCLCQSFNMNVIGADIMELPTELSHDWHLDGFISLTENAKLTELTAELLNGTHEYLRGQKYNYSEQVRSVGIDVIVVASGGWEGDPSLPPPSATGELLLTKEEAQTMTLAAQRYTESVIRMRNMNLDPVIAAGVVAQNLSSNENGLMVVIGASAALSPTPGMMGYGLAKVATHHLVQTLGMMTAEGNSLERKSLQRQAKLAQQPRPYMTVLGILPTTIDTPNNRRSMPNGDFRLWAKPMDIAMEIGKWAENPNLRPHSGSLVKVHGKPGGGEGADFELVY
ncbi:hypothetical protein ACA910_002628 [Epithemia clementina (nom. ined.)]